MVHSLYAIALITCFDSMLQALNHGVHLFATARWVQESRRLAHLLVGPKPKNGIWKRIAFRASAKMKDVESGLHMFFEYVSVLSQPPHTVLSCSVAAQCSS